MTIIYSMSADRQERYDSVRPEVVAKTIKVLQRKGQLNIKVLPANVPQVGSCRLHEIKKRNDYNKRNV
jgi:hypothetical protein